MNNIVQFSWHLLIIISINIPFYYFFAGHENNHLFNIFYMKAIQGLLRATSLTNKLIFILPCALQWSMPASPNTLQIQNYTVYLHLSVILGSRWSTYLLKLCEIYVGLMSARQQYWRNQPSLSWWEVDITFFKNFHFQYIILVKLNPYFICWYAVVQLITNVFAIKIWESVKYVSDHWGDNCPKLPPLLLLAPSLPPLWKEL